MTDGVATGRPLRARIVHTRYPHMGAHSGMIQFARHFDPARVEAHVYTAADSDEDFPVRHAAVRERLRAAVQRRGMPWYKLSDLYAEWRALGAAVRGRADVVHFLDGEHAPQFLPALLRPLGARRARTVGTFHQPAELLGDLLDARAVAALDLVTVVSPTQVEWFTSAAPGTRVEVVLHGVDAAFFSPGPPRAIRPGVDELNGRAPFRCITTGHWLRDWTAVRAVAERFAGDPGVEFHVVTSRETGLGGLPNVVTHRGISDEDLLALYRGADVLFLPLTGATANNSLLEGIACGLPAVTTALESVRAYLPPTAGVLAEQNAPGALADAVDWLRRDDAARARMGAAARARAEMLAWPSIAAQLARSYQSLF